MAHLSALHDAYAESYDDDLVAAGAWQADALFGLAFEFILPGAYLLDVGIGTGQSSLPFARSGARIVGIDFAPEMLALCQAKGFAERLLEHDLQETPWPLPAAQFDIVLCVGVTHFMDDLGPLISEGARVGRPGGYLAFTVMDPWTPLDAGVTFCSEAVGEFLIFGHGRGYVAVLLAQYGFRIRKALVCLVGNRQFRLIVAQSVS